MNPFLLRTVPECERSRPLLLVIMDGVGLYRGLAEGYPANAVDRAATPNLDRIFTDSKVFLELKAHGRAVGLPSDADMGNSEVGHNTIGAGRVFEQGAKLVNKAIESGDLFQGPVWQKLVSRARDGGTFHLIGLLSDGNVHSHIDQLFSLVERLAGEGVQRVRIHPLADGRDVDPVTYHEYVRRLEDLLDDLRTQRAMDGAIASGGGRMVITMDRYGADWDMVRRGWQTHVLGKGRGFPSALRAIEVLRERTLASSTRTCRRSSSPTRTACLWALSKTATRSYFSTIAEIGRSSFRAPCAKRIFPSSIARGSPMFCTRE